MYECLSTARPVLISDQTPWSRVDKLGAGKVFKIDKKNELLVAIENFCMMETTEWQKYCKAALSIANSYSFAAQKKHLDMIHKVLLCRS